MFHFRRFFPILLCLFLIVSTPVSAQDSKADKTKETKVTVPLVTDIENESAGDFLDIRLDDLQKQAFDAYNKADYKMAAEYYLTLLKYNIRDSVSIYNLACCYGLMGNANLAAKYLERAVKAGFIDMGQITQDPDFDKVKGKPAFDDVLKNLETVMAEKEKEMGTVIQVDSQAFFQCRVHLPANYDPNKAYPLIVGLHGLGSNTERFITLWKKFGNPDFIYATPQAPYAFAGGSEIGYSWMTRGPEADKIEDKSTQMSEDYIEKVVVNLHKKFKVGDTYLMGFSQGAGFTYQAGIKHYELFKGIICFGGWLNTEWIGEDAIIKAKGLRVFIAHGTNDRVVNFEAGTKARDYLKSNGYNVTFYQFDGGHEVPADALKAVEKWMQEK